MDDGGVVVKEAVLDGQRRNFGEENTSESIGDTGIEADEREGGFGGGVTVEFDLERFAELVLGPFMIFVRIMTREVCCAEICNCFCVDSYKLRKMLARYFSKVWQDLLAVKQYARLVGRVTYIPALQLFLRRYHRLMNAWFRHLQVMYRIVNKLVDGGVEIVSRPNFDGSEPHFSVNSSSTSSDQSNTTER